MKWYRKAAEQGLANAQYKLGVAYVTGNGVEKDAAEAVKWYRKAAEQGYAKAQCFLGLCYAEGYGVTKDEAEAAKWYHKAAEQGHALAQKRLLNQDRMTAGERFFYGVIGVSYLDRRCKNDGVV